MYVGQDRYEVTPAAAERLFPEAFVYFDEQCGDVRCDRMRFRLYRKKGTYAQGQGYVSRDRLLCVIDDRQLVWHPKANVWVRFSCGIRTRG